MDDITNKLQAHIELKLLLNECNLEVENLNVEIKKLHKEVGDTHILLYQVATLRKNHLVNLMRRLDVKINERETEIQRHFETEAATMLSERFRRMAHTDTEVACASHRCCQTPDYP